MTLRFLTKASLAMLTATCLMSVCASFLACGHNGQERNSGSNDSLYTLDNIKTVAITDAAKALNMLDTAENRKLIPQYDIYGMKSVIYNNVYNQSAVALNYMRKVYECPECASDTTLLVKTLKTLGMLNYQLGYYSDAMKYLKKGMEVARKTGNVEGEAYFTMNLGFVKSALGTTDEAVRDIDESIALFKQTGAAQRDLYTADNILMACMKKIDLFVSEKEFEKAEKAVAECMEAYETMEKCEGVTKRHLDCRLAETAALRGIVYHGLGDREKAERYFNMVVGTEYAKTPAGTTTVIPCFMYMQKYKSALANLAEQERYYVNAKDTMSEGFIDGVLHNQMVAYDKLGMYREATAVGLRLKVLADSLKARERNGKVLEMMTAYETEKKEAMLRENALKMSQMRLFIYAVGIVCVLLVVVIGIVLHYNKRIRRRNMATVKTIEELMEQKDELLGLHINSTENQEEKKNSAKNLKKYLSDVNMRIAVKMLKGGADKTVAEIARECGWGSEAEFCRYFEKKYGISPLEYRKWSNKLRNKEQQVDDNEEFKRNLLRNISHEIRTPLNQITGFAQLLTAPGLDIAQSEKEQFNNIIMSQANHMTRMVNDFVEITEYESSKTPLKREDITMRDLFEKMLAAADKPKNGVELKAVKQEMPQRIVRVNVKAMVRMAQCLLDNAFKFTSEGEISLDLTADDDKGVLRMTVADTGKGVSQNNEKRIFERFYKEDTFVPGVGLGLSLVRIIAERMGGTVFLDTTYNRPGTRFVVEIPLT